ncbi:histidine phosphatase family protein [Tepidiforma sp.]|uniref:histidine phosphatase family protein n=1 Tax=Tepidiforma sp. TaxID=2682230 RepID=UPI002ADE2037|nr:histidine phosphatase family protein [Tepidiforma sp.]
MRLLLVRHGESEGNARRIFQGHLPYPLSELGRRQAEVTAERLARVSPARVVSSPLLRARETAERVASRAGLQLQFLEELTEYDPGILAGLTIKEARERHPEAFFTAPGEHRVVLPGEEGPEPFRARLRRALEVLAEFEGTTVAVTHGGVIGAICHLLVGHDGRRPGIFRVENCSVTEVVRDGAGRLVIARHNDTCHLAPLAGAAAIPQGATPRGQVPPTD